LTDASGGPPPLVVTDVEAAQRYEARFEEDLAGFMEYVVKYGRLALIHTEVIPAFEGMGVGSVLVAFAMGEARLRGLRVIATCPFVRAYVERHPETHDIVVGLVATGASDEHGTA
jgi:predicted GNAT family acetyltransferase